MTTQSTDETETIYTVKRLTVAVPGAREFQERYEQAVPTLPLEQVTALVHRGAPWSEMLELIAESAPHGFLSVSVPGAENRTGTARWLIRRKKLDPRERLDLQSGDGRRRVLLRWRGATQSHQPLVRRRIRLPAIAGAPGSRSTGSTLPRTAGAM
jgi:hypothetical protein